MRTAASSGRVFRIVALVVVLLVGVVLTGGAVWYVIETGNPAPTFRVENVSRGNLVARINATGTIEPEEVIDVGAQVAGLIKQFGRDPRNSQRPIDFGTLVDKSTVLAQLDDSLFRAQAEQARANVDMARAALQKAQATVLKTQATVREARAELRQNQSKHAQADKLYRRARAELRPTRTISDQEFDQAEANSESAAAAVALSEATVAKNETSIQEVEAARNEAAAALKKAQASLHEAEINLGYTVIRSPVKGVIIDRRVNVGQTVVASLNAPSLFLLATDLSRLQVWVSVSEADIGHIKVGQSATFEVDTYPNEQFRGEVFQIRLNATMTQNVVTYTVVVNTDNPTAGSQPGRLLPYMSTNLQFQVGERSDVLLVPTAALRFRPATQRVALDCRDAYEQSLRRRAAAAEEAPPGKGKKMPANRATVWVQEGKFVRPIKVRTGLSDGVSTEIVEAPEGALAVGTPLVTGEVVSDGSDAMEANPFTPPPTKK